MYKQPKHYVDICNPADDTFMDDLNKHFIQIACMYLGEWLEEL